MHIGILPQVECRQVKTETVDRTDQAPERTAGRQQSCTSLGQRVRNGDQISAQLLGSAVRHARYRGAPRRRPPGDLFIGRGKPGVTAGEARRYGSSWRAGLVSPLASANASNSGGRRIQLTGDRQLRAQCIQLLQVMSSTAAAERPSA